MGTTIAQRLEMMKTNFVELAKTEKNPQRRTRFLALAHISEGKSYLDVAEMLKVHFQSVRRWVRDFLASGMDGLKDKKGRGSKPLLAKSQEKDLLEAINKKYEELKGGRIFGYDIQQILKDQFNIACSMSTVYDILHRMGLSWISARSKSPNVNFEEQEEFKKKFRKTLNQWSQNPCH